MRRRRFNLPFRLVSACLIIILGIGLGFTYSFKLLKSLDYFKIKEITIKEQDLPNQDIKTNDFSYLKGKPIFDINLNYAAGVLLEAYPNYSRVKLIRVFPDRLFVYFIKRRPIASVRLYKYFCLDEEGALFSLNTAELESLELPYVVGLEKKIFAPTAGKRYNLKEIALAINIIKEFKENKALREYRIKKIDLSSLAEAAMYLSLPEVLEPAKEGPRLQEVRLGQGNIRAKLILLSGLLTQLKDELAKIKYIDLRFKDPLIKYK